MKTTYKINEIFYSLQGEGAFSGAPAIFIRFSGCNKKCWFCDTEYDTFNEYTISDLLAAIKEYPCNRVILTGGEPMLQVDKDIIDSLHFYHYVVHIETNGSIEIPRDKLQFDWITVSPKDDQWHQRSGDELKVVYAGQSIDELKQYTEGYFTHYYLQPCFISGDKNKTNNYLKETIKVCKENSIWKLSAQMHKVWNIR